jgi:hypothetical protein
MQIKIESRVYHGTVSPKLKCLLKRTRNGETTKHVFRKPGTKELSRSSNGNEKVQDNSTS